MRRLSCRCGQAVYFDNHQCTNCTRQLGFDPVSLSMRAEEAPGAGMHFCRNRNQANRCNWLLEPGQTTGPCLSCRSSEVIPVLSKPENRQRWRKLEAGKRRLLYDLLSAGLPVDTSSLRFVFKEDRRTNPDVHEDHVNVGHAEGVITINAAEADDVYREQMREQMNEPYRTLLGHFRHESGHYYFDALADEIDPDRIQQLFGDMGAEYDQALQRYYLNGPNQDWRSRHITAYASAHPAEDWAETWAHYLHIRSVLETAVSNSLIDDIPATEWQSTFIGLALSLNEIMRSLGLPDAYPFVITAPVAEKLAFVHEIVERVSRRRGEPLDPEA